MAKSPVTVLVTGAAGTISFLIASLHFQYCLPFWSLRKPGKMREFCDFHSEIFILYNKHFYPESKINLLSTKSSTSIQLDCGGFKWVFHSMEVSKYNFFSFFSLVFFESVKSHISSQKLNPIERNSPIHRIFN